MNNSTFSAAEPGLGYAEEFHLLKIISATIDHLDGLAPLFDEYRRFFTGGASEAESHSFIRERLENRDSALFVADDAGATVAFVQLYPLLSSWYCKRMWFLSDLYVAQPARGRGIATLLIAHALSHASESDASKVLVEIPKSEPKLYEFYKRFGFEQDPVFDLFRYTVERTSKTTE